jgi:hypothetical protein
MAMQKFVVPVISFAALLLAMVSCVKNDPAVATAPPVSVNIINASEEVLNFYLNGTRQNNITGLFPLGANGYTSIPSGNQLLAFRRQFNTTNFNNADTLFTLPLRLDMVPSTIRYSVFLTGTSRSTAFTILDTLQNDDKNARLRFVAASAEVTGLRVFLNDTLRFTSSAFKAKSSFIPVGNGSKVIKICPATSNNVLYTSTVTLNINSNYTLFSAGRDTSFRAGLLLNQ